jgi:hypothetical protein
MDGAFRRADFTTSNKTSPDPATRPAMMLYNPPSPIALRIGAATCDRTQPRIPRERPFTAITVDPLPWIKSGNWLDQLGIEHLRSESYGLPHYNPLDTMLCPNTSTCKFWNESQIPLSATITIATHIRNAPTTKRLTTRDATCIPSWASHP